MKRTRNFISISMMTALVFSVLSCAGGKDNGYALEQNPPFSFGTVFYQDWVAGIAEGGSGTNVHIAIDNYKEDVVIMNVYFRNKKVKAQNSPVDRNQYVGYFKKEGRPDVIMDSDPVKEAQNSPLEKFPFQLEDNEAVLSYMQNQQLKYVKISNMEEKPMLAYPSTNSGNPDEN